MGSGKWRLNPGTHDPSIPPFNYTLATRLAGVYRSQFSLWSNALALDQRQCYSGFRTASDIEMQMSVFQVALVTLVQRILPRDRFEAVVSCVLGSHILEIATAP